MLQTFTWFDKEQNGEFSHCCTILLHDTVEISQIFFIEACVLLIFEPICFGIQNMLVISFIKYNLIQNLFLDSLFVGFPFSTFNVDFQATSWQMFTNSFAKIKLDLSVAYSQVVNHSFCTHLYSIARNFPWVLVTNSWGYN